MKPKQMIGGVAACALVAAATLSPATATAEVVSSA